MHETMISHYPLVSTTCAISRLINVNEFETKSLMDYMALFKTNCDVMKIRLGKGVLGLFVEKSEPYCNGIGVL